MPPAGPRSELAVDQDTDVDQRVLGAGVLRADGVVVGAGEGTGGRTQLGGEGVDPATGGVDRYAELIDEELRAVFGGRTLAADLVRRVLADAGDAARGERAAPAD